MILPVLITNKSIENHSYCEVQLIICFLNEQVKMHSQVTAVYDDIVMNEGSDIILFGMETFFHDG